MLRYILKLIGRAYISVVSVIFFVITADLVISLFFPDIVSPESVYFNPFATDENLDKHVREGLLSHYYLDDRELFWRLNPGKGEISQEGFRSSRLYGDKRESVYRIVALGDSCTYGIGADGIESSYPARLESILNEAPDSRRVEVINAGVSGYASLQGLWYLKEIMPEYRPDLVIVQFLHNDGVSWLNRPDSKVVMPGKLAWNMQMALREWRIYELMRMGMIKLNRLISRNPPPDSPKPYRVSPEEYKQNLIEMANLARSGGAEIILIVPPALPPYRHRPDFTDYRDATIAAASETGAKILDLTKTFDNLDKLESYFWRPEADDLAHLNVKGYDLQARLAADLVREMINPP